MTDEEYNRIFGQSMETVRKQVRSYKIAFALITISIIACLVALVYLYLGPYIR